MLVIGDVTCLHCGFELGEWTGKRGAALTIAGFKQSARPAGSDEHAAVRCFRCQGPVLLSNLRAAITPERLRRIQRMRDQLAIYEAETRRVRRRAA